VEKVLSAIQEILKGSSENLVGLSFGGGFVLVFFSFFRWEDKSITVYPTPSLWSFVSGIVLIAVAYLLRIIKKPNGRAEKPEDLTDRLVFLLRHYQDLGKDNSQLPEYFAQAVFEYDHPDQRLTDANREAWVKVSDYAARYMALLGVLKNKGPEYAINAAGWTLMGKDDFRAKNTHSFAKKLASLP
jgi:hypothetical protein